MKLIKIKKKRSKYYNKNIRKEQLATVKFGIFGLKTRNSGILTIKQLETIRRLVSRKTKRLSKFIIRIFFQHPIRKKSLLSRMGKGIGSIKSWVSWVVTGRIILEISNISYSMAVAVLKEASYRLPIKVTTVRREVIKSSVSINKK